MQSLFNRIGAAIEFKDLSRGGGHPKRGVAMVPILRETGFWLLCGAGVVLAIWHYSSMVLGYIS